MRHSTQNHPVDDHGIRRVEQAVVTALYGLDWYHGTLLKLSRRRNILIKMIVVLGILFVVKSIHTTLGQ
jgi:hypothetical protein